MLTKRYPARARARARARVTLDMPLFSLSFHLGGIAGVRSLSINGVSTFISGFPFSIPLFSFLSLSFPLLPPLLSFTFPFFSFAFALLCFTFPLLSFSFPFFSFLSLSFPLLPPLLSFTFPLFFLTRKKCDLYFGGLVYNYDVNINFLFKFL